MNFNLDQKIFNIYRHHDKDLLDSICGPAFEKQLGYAKEYITDILHILISDFRYGEDQNFSIPEVNLDWLNVSIKELRKSGTYNKLIISNNDNEILLSTADKFDNDISGLYDFLSKIYENAIKRDKFFFWSDNIIQNNKELSLIDTALNGLYDAYKIGILSINALNDAYKELTSKSHTIFNSNIDIFCDYKMFTLAFLFDEHIMIMPHVLENSLIDFFTFDLEYLVIEQRAKETITLKPIYSKKIVKDYQSLIGINKIRFQNKTSMFYESDINKYTFEINSNQF